MSTIWVIVGRADGLTDQHCWTIGISCEGQRALSIGKGEPDWVKSTISVRVLPKWGSCPVITAYITWAKLNISVGSIWTPETCFSNKSIIIIISPYGPYENEIYIFNKRKNVHHWPSSCIREPCNWTCPQPEWRQYPELWKYQNRQVLPRVGCLHQKTIVSPK